MTDTNLSGTTVAAENLNQPVIETTESDNTFKEVESLEEVVENTVEETQEKSQEASTENSEENNGEKAKKKLTGWQRQQRKLERLERENEELKASKQSNPALVTAPVQTDKEPNLNDYESYDAYNKALVRHEAKQLLKAELDARDTQTRATQQNQSWNTKVNEAVKEMPDYHELMSEYEDVPVRQEILDATAESDIGPKMRYHLAKNPELLEEINAPNVSSYKIFAKLAQIEAELTGSGQKDKAVVKKVTQSPPPITPVKRGSSTTVSLAEMSTEDFIKYRNSVKK